ncbi:hypothetical protein O6H91_21G000300 [Diphasiastrum complanatum]|uniref:Uncharacterized protein n=1 Tax=Diphasiastrum complanatum TaxID=34168 RepID=A0ACC2AGX8_DIPCM|nr:hypothetical protein O6H91_Y072300 [Diphasiastrum complanatum]KAJ7516825.1 hypothetical protein O6H91_21G000300 [Diphasiastrum complanatum]
MAGNDWINGYLEAILDSGAGIDDHRTVQSLPSESRESAGFNATKYFVEEVVTGFDETDIHHTWMKATATRDAKERSARLENLCWRIWHLTRKKKQNEWDDAQRVAYRSSELERGRKEAAEDMSEDFSEGEKTDPGSEVVSCADGGAEIQIARKFSEQELWSDQPKNKSLYIVMISLHGLVRGENMELGRDSDTGGQVKYVVEFARALAMMPQVYRVDLLTRQISAPDVDCCYGEPTEMLTSLPYDGVDLQEIGESSGAYIVRIPCGPRDKYLRKELLWPHIQEFVDGALAHILNMAKVLGEQIAGGEAVWPHVVHGHYADAGDIASLLSGALNVPMVLTGHSLGRSKLEQLMKQGRQSKEDINATYRIMRRIEAEELSLDAAELVITSTRQEINEQWGLYDGFDVKLERVLRARAKNNLSCNGRFMPRMVVIPPGMDFSNVIVQDGGDLLEGDAEAIAFTGSDGTTVTPMSPRADPAIWSEIMRFFTNPHKPMILALARPDPKKNMTTLVKAFGECKPLRELANLTLIMGNRDDIDEMSGGNANVLTTVLKLIDKYDLYGQVAYPKHHKQSDVPEIYRLAAKTKGVFINPALVEPFGLTLIEAAAHGLPMVATMNGGPVDIHRTLSNGVLVDPHNEEAIAGALLNLVADRNTWTECRRNGLKNIHLYSWPAHCKTYLSKVALCRMRHPQWQNNALLDSNMDSESQGDSLRDVQDISLRLSDDGERSVSLNKSLEAIIRNTHGDIEQLKQALEKHRQARKEISHEEAETKKPQLNEKFLSSGGTSTRLPPLRKRMRLFVIAVDSYDHTTDHNVGLLKIIREIFRAVHSEAGGRLTGFVLSTSLTISETISLLQSDGILPQEFDAFICSSGSELYYPVCSIGSEEIGSGSDMQLILDSDYVSHIDYHWEAKGLRKVIARLTVPEERNGERFMVEDRQRSNSHCLAYTVKNASKAPKVDEIRKRLRMRGFRCHLMYCHNAKKLHVLPLLASRSQALRWNVDVANMLVFVGEIGDTDREEMLAGMHKTIILRGVVKDTSEHMLRSNGSYSKEDVVPAESPHVAYTDGDFSCETVLAALRKLS